MSRWTKRIVPSLVFFAVWQLVFHWLDMYWNVMPSYDWTTVQHGGASLTSRDRSPTRLALHHVGFSLLDVTVWLGLVGVFLIGVSRELTGNLIPVKDPDPRAVASPRAAVGAHDVRHQAQSRPLNTIGVVVVGICGAVLVYVSIIALQAFYMNDTSELQTMADYGGQDTTAKSHKAEELRNITEAQIGTPSIAIDKAMALIVRDAAKTPIDLIPALGPSTDPTEKPQPGRPEMLLSPAAAPAAGSGAGSAAPPATEPGAGSAAAPAPAAPAMAPTGAPGGGATAGSAAATPTPKSPTPKSTTPKSTTPKSTTPKATPAAAGSTGGSASPVPGGHAR